MKSILKALLIVLGILLGGVVAATVFLPFYFDPNDYKKEIAAAVKKQTGREFAVAGKIKLTVFPWLGMELNEASLGNAPGFGSEPLAKIKSANVGVRLQPLLHKQIEVGTVRLDGLVLHLAKNAQGKGNWEDIGPEKKEEEKAEPKDKKPFKVQSTQIAGVNISDAALFWDDAQSGSHYKLSKFNFKSGELRSGKPFKLDSSFVLANAKTGSSTDVELKGDVKADVKTKVYQVHDLKVNATSTGKSVPGGKQKIDLSGDMALSLAQQQLRLQNLVLKVAGVEMKGEASGSQILSNAVYTGNLSSSVNPRDIFKALGKEDPKTADPDVLKKASFTTQFSSTTKQLNLKQLQMKLDDSTINGTATVQDFSHPLIGVNLRLDSIDLDRYMSPAKKDEGGPPGAATKVPVDAVKPLNLNGTLSVGHLKMKNMHFNNAQLTVHSKNGVMNIEPLTANFYDGQINMTSRIDATGARPNYAVNATVSGVQAQRMLKDMLGKESLVGAGNMQVNVTSAGSTTDEIKRALNGTVAFDFKDGHVNGFNVMQKIRQANALRKGQSLKDVPAPQQTDFSTVAATLHIVNGAIRNDDLTGKSPSLLALGAGNASLVNESIDYLAKISLQDVASLGGDLAELKDFVIPIRITGSLFKPKWQVDFGSLLKGKLKGELEKQQKKLQEKAQDQLKGSLENALGIGGAKKGAAATTEGGAATEGASTTGTAPAAEEKPKSTEDQIKDLFGKKKKKKKPQVESAPTESAPVESAPAQEVPAAEPAPETSTETAPAQ